jgi:carbamoyltransferase
MKPTYILGLNSFHADASAVLLKDGELVAAVAEERLNRIKHFAGFPARAIQEVLDIGGIGVAEVDHIGINKDNKANLLAKLGFALTNLGRISRLARQRLEYRAKAASAPTLICKALGVAPTALRAKVHHVEHHLCHAASCFYVSEFERAAIMTIDGFGDFASTMTALGVGTTIKILDRTLFPHSLGIVYTMICQFIGYDRYGDEGKVMGLAPYGKPVYEDFFDRLVHLKPNGRFELNLDYFVHHTEGVDYSFDDLGNPTVAPLFSQEMLRQFGPPRQRHGELTQRDMNLAASLQQCTEKVYFHLLHHLHKQTRCANLCLAGGVALNSVANGKIFEQTEFRQIYTQAAAGDDGTALGVAYYIHHAVLNLPRHFIMDHAYTGREYSESEIEADLRRTKDLSYERLPDAELFQQTARAIARGDIVGWFQGKCEWGPRALGNRSIIAHPGLPDMKNILNSRIKHREWFRPFAPSILEERVGEYFANTYPSPFMLLVYSTQPDKRQSICAINHVDNTGRLQTVSRRQNPRYHALIEAVERETGVPIVLNTSFNENEPIVYSPADAVGCFVRTKMDLLVLGNWMVRKVSNGKEGQECSAGVDAHAPECVSGSSRDSA